MLNQYLPVILLAAGFTAATLSASLAIYGLMHDFRTDDGRITPAGRRAVFGTAALGIVSMLLFIGQYIADDVSSKRQAKRDRELLDLIAITAIPTIELVSATIEYPADAYLEATGKKIIEYINADTEDENCGSFPYVTSVGDTALIYERNASGGFVDIASFQNDCWEFVREWVEYLGIFQGGIAVSIKQQGADEFAQIDYLEIQPWGNDWQDASMHYGINLETGRSEMHLIRVPPNSGDRKFFTLVPLLGGRIRFDLGTTLGTAPAGYSASPKAASAGRELTNLKLHLANGLVVNLGAGKNVFRDNDSAEAQIDMPPNVPSLINHLNLTSSQ